MSADVWIERYACPHCGRGEYRDTELNITYNLSRMLKAAGFCGWSDLLGMPAKEAGEHILSVLDYMAEEPEKWRAMNPSNGWGSYDSCLQDRMRAFAEECRQAGESDVIGGWL